RNRLSKDKKSNEHALPAAGYQPVLRPIADDPFQRSKNPDSEIQESDYLAIFARSALASLSGISRMKTLRKRISELCVCSSMGPVAGTGTVFGFDLSKKLSSTWPSTVSLSFNQIQTRVPAMRILNVFHWPTGLSALTSGHLPGFPSTSFQSAPDPLGAP